MMLATAASVGTTNADLRRALRFIVPYWRRLALVLALSVASTALSLYLPLLSREAGITRINGLYRHGWLIAPAIVEEALAQELLT